MEKNEVVVEISARHVHLTREDMDTLFGKGSELTFKKALTQPGQFASEEKVRVIGPKGEFPHVTILGPLRKYTQVELSLTDARSIGVSAPVRISGDLEGAGACKIIGPKGEIDVKEGVIAARRHIHATPEDAEREGLPIIRSFRWRFPPQTKEILFSAMWLCVFPIRPHGQCILTRMSQTLPEWRRTQ